MRRISLLYFSAALLLACQTIAPAQSVRGSFGFFQLGYLNAPKSGNVARTFAPDWFPSLNDHFIYSGAEGWLRRNRLMAGLSASALTARSISVQQTRVERAAGIGQIKLGYVLFDTRRWVCYSAIGQGISSSLITIHQDGFQPHIAVLSSHSTDLSLHLNRLLVPDPSVGPEETKGFWLGLRIGYVASSKSAHWQQLPDGQPNQVKPEYALNGFYVTLTVGGGGFHYAQ
ncbi:hypothetical protein [Larkinella rosea]|uniref:Outer membrane protein beta-barrel domain-containing protein n=1 Tax=Larkinella rosea TaxID=2025312 RepID=A0A3P1BGC5_9BACT|nr:hypothetical protein [Larkinella rosea]RRA99991.1 hypothetical protein EHT25_25545 [Larkinella rosea]